MRKMGQKKRKAIPLAYFITFTSYGTWLHGGRKTSVDRQHNKPDTVYVPLIPTREVAAKANMTEVAYLLNQVCRDIVLNTIKEVCAHHAWELFAAHVRTNHVHCVVRASVSPEKVMNTIKAYASRHLTKIDSNRLKYWTRHGSTRYLWRSEDIMAAVRYVVLDQGKPMALFDGGKCSLEFDEMI